MKGQPINVHLRHAQQKSASLPPVHLASYGNDLGNVLDELLGSFRVSALLGILEVCLHERSFLEFLDFCLCLVSAENGLAVFSSLRLLGGPWPENGTSEPGPWERKRTKKACEGKTKLHLKLHFILTVLCEVFKEN